MPKLGMEPIRRKALIEAAISTIHEKGSLEVTMGQIARRAGVSSGLAHHYFGSKDELITATMRHLLSTLSHSVSEELAKARGPRARISSVIGANFAPEQFAADTVSAWLVFYVRAQSSHECRRLLRIYARRLHANLAYDLAALAPRQDAERIARGAAAMIDGLYIRHALRDGPPMPEQAAALVEDYVDAQLARSRHA